MVDGSGSVTVEVLAWLITHRGEPDVTVDNIEVAQFVYLLLRNGKIRDVINTVARKGVLLLGRFTEGRMAVLDPRRFRPRHGRLQHRAPAQAPGPEGRSPASDMKSQRTTTRLHAKTPNLSRIQPQKIALALLVAQTH